jgi:hypothetical protein
MNEGTLDLAQLESELVAEHAAITKRMNEAAEAHTAAINALKAWTGKRDLFLHLKSKAQPASAETPTETKE